MNRVAGCTLRVETKEDIDSAELEDSSKAYDVLGSKINKFIQFVEEEWR